MQKRWSHINPHLIGPLDEKEVSLKVNRPINQLFPTCQIQSKFFYDDDQFIKDKGTFQKIQSLHTIMFNQFYH